MLRAVGFLALRGKLSWHKPKRSAVVAIAQASGVGAIFEHVALVPEATRAMIFRPRCEQQEVLLRPDVRLVHAEETRPAGSGIELPLRAEELKLASGANERPAPMFVVERARAGAFGGFLAQHPERQRFKPRTPLRLGETTDRIVGIARFIGGGWDLLRLRAASGDRQRGCGKEEDAA